MTDETAATTAAEEEFSAAAPPHPGAAGTRRDARSATPRRRPPRARARERRGRRPRTRRAKYLALAQRTQADFENYRKRMARENAAAADRGMAKLAKELLPALDHLELALQAAEEHGGGRVRQGLRAWSRTSWSARSGASASRPFSPKGEPFDPNEHEAMASQPVEGAESGTVVEVYQQGYRINGAVLRPARVVVAA